MAQATFNLPESTSRTQTHKVTIDKLVSITKITVGTGNVTIQSVNGTEVIIQVSSGSYSRRVQTGGSYTPAYSKQISGYNSGSGTLAQAQAKPTSISYSSGGYSGTLRLNTNWHGGDSYSWSYSGTVSRPESDTRTYAYYYQYDVVIDYIDNSIPTLTQTTADIQTLSECPGQNELLVEGTAKDTDANNTVTIKM